MVVADSWTGTPRAQSRSSDARRLFFFLFLLMAMGVQGVRSGGIPLPTLLPFSVLYFLIFQPPLTQRLMKVYAVVFSYMLLVTIRNALEPTGGWQDFLYFGIIVTSFLITVCLIDIVRLSSLRTIGLLILGFFCAEIFVQFAEKVNFLGFNQWAASLIAYWVSLAEVPVTEAVLGSRPGGTLAYPTLAGPVCYLLARSAALALNRRWMIYLAIIPLMLTGARMTTLIFFVWEVVVPLIYSQYRKLALMIVGLAAGSVVGLYFMFPEIFESSFLFAQFARMNTIQLIIASDTVYNRVEGIRWSLSHLDDMLTTGGITVAQFTAYESSKFAVDSELILRSLQFGFFGYICLCVMDLWPGYNRKDADWWFLVFLVLASSQVITFTTQFIIFPFVILYGVVLKAARDARTLAAPISEGAQLIP